MSDLKPNLIVITDYYPYGNGEPFIENEMYYLASRCNVSIISSDIDSNNYRDVPEAVSVYRCSSKIGYSFIEKTRYIFHYFFSLTGIRETLEILKSKKQTRKRIVSSIYDFIRSESFYKQVKKKNILKKGEKYIIYTYWSNYKTLAFTRRKRKNWKIITRMQGYDLYNERMLTGRQTFKSSMEKGLDAICFVSEMGRNYYKDFFLKTDRKLNILKLFRLGTDPAYSFNMQKDDSNFILCSCSNVIPLKRVNLIACALKSIHDVEIVWYHFGDGESFNELNDSINDLPKNITVHLCGRISNIEIRKFYANHYVDCFITITSTEGGCPVSIQEAMSYGIPIIATAVGGIPEMLIGTENILLQSNPTIDEIVEAIKSMMTIEQAYSSKLRSDNILRWNELFNAKTNNEKFYKFLCEL